MYWRLLARILEAHYGGLFVVNNADLAAEYLRVCLDAERLLDDPSLADLQASYARPVDSLLSGADDSDWNHGIKQRCGRLLRMVEKRVIMENADDGLLASEDLEYRRRAAGMLDRHTSSKSASERACLDAAKGAMGKPGGAAGADPGGGDAALAADDGAAGRPPAGARRAHDVFLSYSHEAKDSVARPLAEGLEERGVGVWWDHGGVRIGDKLPQKIKEGLDGAGHGVVVVSRGYLSSGWGQAELGAMFGKGMPIFPILHGVTAAEAQKALPVLSERSCGHGGTRPERSWTKSLMRSRQTAATGK